MQTKEERDWERRKNMASYGVLISAGIGVAMLSLIVAVFGACHLMAWLQG